MKYTEFPSNERRPRPDFPAPTCLVYLSARSGQRGCCVVNFAFAVDLLLVSGPVASGQEGVIDTRNRLGVLRTITLDGNPLDTSNPFFQSLGTNGRSCFSYHVASSA